MGILNIAKQLVQLSPRFAQGEERTALFIRKFFLNHNLSFIDQEYEISVPIPKKVELLVDGDILDCRNVGTESGKFNSKNELVSSLYWGDNDFYLPQNINFNPQCKRSVSMAMYYKHPAIAIKRDDISKILQAKEIRGITEVERYTFIGHNYLVGNIINPKNVIFTHYDCWESGAIDNASGTSVLMYIVANNPEILKENLFVIAGSEEISYDEPIYWGKGYREFQKQYFNLLNKAASIIIIDCVGYSEHEWISEPSHVALGLPLNNFNILSKKCKMLTGNFEKLMEVYHSNDDIIELLDEASLQQAAKILVESLI